MQQTGPFRKILSQVIWYREDAFKSVYQLKQGKNENEVILGLADAVGSWEKMERIKSKKEISYECSKALKVSESSKNCTYLSGYHA